MLNLKRKTKTIVTCSVLLSLLLLSSWSLLDPTYNFLESVSPKTASNEISIITPEDKTYTEAMSGYYPATYGFENDDDGSDPAGWNVFEGAGYVNVIDEINNHKKVVEMYDNTNANHDELHNVFPLQTYGTVEFWVMSDDVSDTFSIRLLDDTATSVWGNGIGWLQFYQDYIRYQDNTSTNHNVKPVNDNKWYHIKIEFECSTGNYQGLAQDTWRFYINGEEFGDFGFLNDIDNVAQLYFFTRGANYNYRYYVDAVGYSWHPNYNIGDNLDEGLLLSFESTITLDWIGYSLNGQPTKTILGDTTIPLPENGAHNIQMFGKDSLETMYESDVRYFSIGFIIDIITPESITYTAPMAGYYPATYGFESDEDGLMPRDWEIIKPNEGNADAYVVGPAYGHNKVIRLYDPWQWWFYPTYVQVKNTFVEQNEGTIDFYLYYTNVVDINLIYDPDDPDDPVEVVKIRFGSGGIIYYLKDGQWIPILFLPSLIANQWYHCQLHFRSNFKWKLTVNDNSMPYLEYSNPGYSINTFMISTDPAACNYYTYIDAVGYSWDPYYDIEDNKYEGLLLKFNPDDLYDMSYTLDGASRTIYGDTVFPMPKSGAHTISVCGTDQYGSDYWGESSFSIQYEEWFGIFMWASDYADGQGASPPFTYCEVVEGNMHQYRDILYDEGFRKFYFYRDVSLYSESDGSEYEAIMDRLEKRIDINDKVFFYIMGHGGHEDDPREDVVYISPASQSGYDLHLDDFEDDIDEFDSIYKGVLIEACQSGEWADRFNKTPYVAALSSSASNEYSEVDEISHQGFFSLHFFAGVQSGMNAEEAFYYAKDQFEGFWISQTPQGFFNPPNPEDPNFMFFD